MINLTGEAIVTSLSYYWNKKPQNYLGLDEFWWGSDLGIVKYGNGKLILSTLRIIENLGKNPVADMIFNNLVRYAVQESSSVM